MVAVPLSAFRELFGSGTLWGKQSRSPLRPADCYCPFGFLVVGFLSAFSAGQTG